MQEEIADKRSGKKVKDGTRVTWHTHPPEMKVETGPKRKKVELYRTKKALSKNDIVAVEARQAMLGRLRRLVRMWPTSGLDRSRIEIRWYLRYKELSPQTRRRIYSDEQFNNRDNWPSTREQLIFSANLEELKELVYEAPRYAKLSSDALLLSQFFDEEEAPFDIPPATSGLKTATVVDKYGIEQEMNEFQIHPFYDRPYYIEEPVFGPAPIEDPKSRNPALYGRYDPTKRVGVYLNTDINNIFTRKTIPNGYWICCGLPLGSAGCWYDKASEKTNKPQPYIFNVKFREELWQNVADGNKMKPLWDETQVGSAWKDPAYYEGLHQEIQEKKDKLWEELEKVLQKVQDDKENPAKSFKDDQLKLLHSIYILQNNYNLIHDKEVYYNLPPLSDKEGLIRFLSKNFLKEEQLKITQFTITLPNNNTINPLKLNYDSQNLTDFTKQIEVLYEDFTSQVTDVGDIILDISQQYNNFKKQNPNLSKQSISLELQQLKTKYDTIFKELTNLPPGKQPPVDTVEQLIEDLNSGLGKVSDIPTEYSEIKSKFAIEVNTTLRDLKNKGDKPDLKNYDENELDKQLETLKENSKQFVKLKGLLDSLSDELETLSDEVAKAIAKNRAAVEKKKNAESRFKDLVDRIFDINKQFPDKEYAEYLKVAEELNLDAENVKWVEKFVKLGINLKKNYEITRTMFESYEKKLNGIDSSALNSELKKTYDEITNVNLREEVKFLDQEYSKLLNVYESSKKEFLKNKSAISNLSPIQSQVTMLVKASQVTQGKINTQTPKLDKLITDIRIAKEKEAKQQKQNNIKQLIIKVLTVIEGNITSEIIDKIIRLINNSPAPNGNWLKSLSSTLKTYENTKKVYSESLGEFERQAQDVKNLLRQYRNDTGVKDRLKELQKIETTISSIEDKLKSGLNTELRKVLDKIATDEFKKNVKLVQPAQELYEANMQLYQQIILEATKGNSLITNLRALYDDIKIREEQDRKKREEAEAKQKQKEITYRIDLEKFPTSIKTFNDVGKKLQRDGVKEFGGYVLYMYQKVFSKMKEATEKYPDGELKGVSPNTLIARIEKLQSNTKDAKYGLSDLLKRANSLKKEDFDKDYYTDYIKQVAKSINEELEKKGRDSDEDNIFNGDTTTGGNVRRDNYIGYYEDLSKLKKDIEDVEKRIQKEPPKRRFDLKNVTFDDRDTSIQTDKPIKIASEVLQSNQLDRMNDEEKQALLTIWNNWAVPELNAEYVYDSLLGEDLPPYVSMTQEKFTLVDSIDSIKKLNSDIQNSFKERQDETELDNMNDNTDLVEDDEEDDKTLRSLPKSAQEPKGKEEQEDQFDSSKFISFRDRDKDFQTQQPKFVVDAALKGDFQSLSTEEKVDFQTIWNNWVVPELNSEYVISDDIDDDLGIYVSKDQGKFVLIDEIESLDSVRNGISDNVINRVDVEDEEDMKNNTGNVIIDDQETLNKSSSAASDPNANKGIPQTGAGDYGGSDDGNQLQTTADKPKLPAMQPTAKEIYPKLQKNDNEKSVFVDNWLMSFNDYYTKNASKFINTGSNLLADIPTLLKLGTVKQWKVGGEPTEDDKETLYLKPTAYNEDALLQLITAYKNAYLLIQQIVESTGKVNSTKYDAEKKFIRKVIDKYLVFRPKTDKGGEKPIVHHADELKEALKKILDPRNGLYLQSPFGEDATIGKNDLKDMMNPFLAAYKKAVDYINDSDRSKEILDVFRQIYKKSTILSYKKYKLADESEFGEVVVDFGSDEKLFIFATKDENNKKLFDKQNLQFGLTADVAIAIALISALEKGIKKVNYSTDENFKEEQEKLYASLNATTYDDLYPEIIYPHFSNFYKTISGAAKQPDNPNTKPKSDTKGEYDDIKGAIKKIMEELYTQDTSDVVKKYYNPFDEKDEEVYPYFFSRALYNQYIDQIVTPVNAIVSKKFTAEQFGDLKSLSIIEKGFFYENKIGAKKKFYNGILFQSDGNGWINMAGSPKRLTESLFNKKKSIMITNALLSDEDTFNIYLAKKLVQKKDQTNFNDFEKAHKVILKAVKAENGGIVIDLDDLTTRIVPYLLVARYIIAVAESDEEKIELLKSKLDEEKTDIYKVTPSIVDKESKEGPKLSDTNDNLLSSRIRNVAIDHDLTLGDGIYDVWALNETILEPLQIVCNRRAFSSPHLEHLATKVCEWESIFDEVPETADFESHTKHLQRFLPLVEHLEQQQLL